MKTDTQQPHNQQLHYPRAWWTLGWILVALVVIGSLVPSPVSLRLTILDKIIHAATYALLIWWFLQIRPHRPVVIALSLAVMGVLIEGLQGFQRGRVPDLLDVAANLAGLAVGMLFARIWTQNAFLRLEARLFRDSG